MFLDSLTNLPIFTVNDVKWVRDNSQIETIRWQLFKYAKSKKIIRLKKWFYTSSVYLKYLSDNWYLYFVANNLVEPSYLSLVTMLDHYGILSESSFGYSCITSLKTQKYSNDLWEFVYQNIRKDLFIWTKIMYWWKYKIYVATKAKALFDFFWYKKKVFSKFDKNELDSFRLNLELLSKSDIKELNKYIKMSKSLKMKSIYNLIKSECGY